MPVPLQLPKICVCIGHADAHHAADLAVASCDRGESFLELRIDHLDDPAAGPGIVERIVRSHPATTVVATCRRAPYGGQFEGPLDQQLSILLKAVAAGAGIVDIEIEAFADSSDVLAPFRGICTTLVSFHDFARTPELAPVIRRLAATGADILKVATHVQRPSDNLRLLALCEDRDNVVVAGMGESGSVARLVSPARRGLFTYAAPDAPASDQGCTDLAAAPTAPGQISAAAVRDLYRVQSASADTPVFAVIAKPVGHSMSPLIHNRSFQALGYDGLYLPMLVEPDDVADFFHTARNLPIRGASVTIPHKQSVLPHLDQVDEAALEIGAVNTIYWDQARLCGTNTDARGIVQPLSQRVKLDGAQVLVVGNGGAARAAIVALRREGAKVSVTGRNPERVRRLAGQLGADAVAFESLASEYFDALVQATSVGMLPDAEGNLFPGRVPADVVFDLVYNPVETALLKRARADKKVTISGVEMFVEQAAAQFRIWTGMEAPRDVMRSAVLGRRVG
ncbi:MAG: shikimate dehydrogenase [Bryobacterales bacterium]|nr:shikimate dehydrogenase [Bryobacterales bacterium]